MAAPSARAGDVRGALGESGALGATTRQIAQRLGRPPVDIAAELTDLSGRGEIQRMGRGLWVLRDYANLGEREDFTDPAVFAERFRSEEGIALGGYSGPITFRSNDRLPVHRWWPYVQGYSAEFVQDLLGTAGVGRGSTVLDPFAGSGTSLVESRRAGARALGYEVLAPAALAARVKTGFELDPRHLRKALRDRLARARRADPAPLPFLRETQRQFSRGALDQMRRLRSVLPPEGSPERDAMRLVFDATLIPCSRLRRSPCLGYDPQVRTRPRPFDQYAVIGEMIADDLEAEATGRERWGPPATVLREDARAVRAPPETIDFAVTSPPYVNGLDYVMNYKLDLAWLGHATSYADLARLREAGVACDNLPREATRAYRSTVDVPDPWLAEILPQIRENVRRKGSYRRDDMHAVVHRYFRDLAEVMRRVHRALRPGARFVLVVGDSLLAGTYVPGDLLTARIGRQVGFSIDGVEVARSRRSGQRRHFLLRESIVTLRKPRSAA